MASLSEYRRKRDFEATPEPAGAGDAPPGGHAVEGRRFVVQKHAASRLHYDFRLELGGTLKSWAVPKGPSLDPAETRLAVRVEDHPVEYGDFEGAIPKGQYGGGTVVLWDRGRWEPVAGASPEPGKALDRGKLEFRLHGEKLAGNWLLVRSSRGGRGRTAPAGKEEWLLRKLGDRHARPLSEGDVLEERPESVASGLTVEELRDRPARVWQSKERPRLRHELEGLRGVREAPLPDFVAPQLATLVKEPPAGDGWLHEIKLDGYRLLCRVEAGRATLLSRNGKDWTDRFPGVASEAPFLPVETALLDGEAVWLRPDGTSDFQALQAALGAADPAAPVYYHAFDLLHLDGHDLTGAPLVERKRLLRRLLEPPPAEVFHLRYSDHVRGSGPAFYARACDMALEGVIAKRAEGRYRPGRGRDWVKVKCVGRQELVIVGWTDPEGSRSGFGSLLLGYHDEAGRLAYAGKVGTGFDRRTLSELHARLGELGRRKTPLDAGAEQARKSARGKGVHWVEPRLVAEVEFTEWTRDGVLRHPSFQGLREDKDPAEVGLERPTELVEEDRDRREREAPAGRRPSRPSSRRAPGDGKARTVAGVRVTSPDRVLDPGAGITKGELVDHYLRVADLMLPHVARRPLTLVRCPTGIGDECFYQKHLAEGVPETLGAVDVEERKGTVETYLTVDSVAGLVTLAQLGVLEIHPWGSRVEHLDRPDRLVFDLDPDPSVGWDRVVRSAHDLRALLADLGLESFPRVTGGKGVHLVVPLFPELDWDRAKELSKAIAGLLAERAPGLYTTNPLKAKREGRIFVDYLRNAFGATAVASYSTRARPGVTVATPVAWEELTPELDPAGFTVRTLPERLDTQEADPWADLAGHGQRLRPEIRDYLQG